MSTGIVKTWYSSSRWQRRRADQLQREPLCRMCLECSTVRVATVADHVEPHRGDALAFWTGRLQSLCQTHHSSDKQALEKSGRVRVAIGFDGYPLGPGREGKG